MECMCVYMCERFPWLWTFTWLLACCSSLGFPVRSSDLCSDQPRHLPRYMHDWGGRRMSHAHGLHTHTSYAAQCVRCKYVWMYVRMCVYVRVFVCTAGQVRGHHEIWLSSEQKVSQTESFGRMIAMAGHVACHLCA